MKCLVTGGAGFIGSHLVRRLLAEGEQVVVLDRSLAGLGADTLAKVEGIQADACDLASVRTAAEGCDRIFAFAALVGVEHYSRNPVETMRVEERALENACAAALAVGCPKVIYPSSSAVYGNAAAGELTEDMLVAPSSNYAVAKRFNELFLRSQFEENGLQSVALRIFNVYGPGQDERLVIPRFVRCGLTGEAVIVFGDGSQSRDFPYVGDVVEAVLRCSQSLSGCEVVNVSSGRAHSIRELAETVIALTGGRSQIEFRSLPQGRDSFEVDRSVGNPGKLENLTGYCPSTPLETGLNAVIERMRHGR